MWDERDREADHPQRTTSSKIPKITAESLTGEHPVTPRVSSTGPVVKRADGTAYLNPGTMFNDKYSIIEVLGDGAMSCVYKARHSVMKNIVAIKIINGTYASNSKAVLRFQREGQAVSRLNHTNIVRTFDFGLSREGQPFLATEFLEGKSLSSLIRQHGPVPFGKALAMFTQVADAMTAAHAAGFMHKDIKPSNIFVLNPSASQPTIKIVDFGLADIFDEEEDGQKKVTLEVPIFGSAEYMSPEQCMGKKLDDRSDVYSMGCLMYDALTGVPPVEGADLLDTLQMQVQEMPRPFNQIVPDKDDVSVLEPIVFKCLAKDPGSRYQTMAQLSRAIREVSDALNASATGSAPVDNTEALAAEERARQNAVLLQRVLIGVVAVALLSTGVGVYLFKSSEVEVPLAGNLEQACFGMDRGKYDEAKQKFESLIDEAKKANLLSNLVRYLGDDAVLQHILADKASEGKDDQKISEVNAAATDKLFLNDSTVQTIDALLAGDKTGAELEGALAEPVHKIATLAQAMAWSQQYPPAQESMSLLIDKVSRKLDISSALVVNLKLRYASMLLQKIVNPASPLTPSERQDLIGEPKALLDGPLNFCTGSDLWLARTNSGLAQALGGNITDATKLRDDVVAAIASGAVGQDNLGLIESRLADTDVALGDAKAALPLYKSAYQKFVTGKQYAHAAYCIKAYSRSCWLAGGLKDRYQFFSDQLQKPEIAAAEAGAVKAELQARLAEAQVWMATVDPSILKKFFAESDIKKSSGDLKHESERLALESLIAVQASRPSDLWLSSSAIDTLSKIYFNGNTVGRAVSLLRLKLAVAERANSDKATDEARNNLAVALSSYGKAPLASIYTSLDHSQISPGKGDPGQESAALYDQILQSVTAGGSSNILWLDEYFADLAAEYAKTDLDRVKLLDACSTSCESVGDVYGKTSTEYMNQLRWHGRLAARLGQKATAQKSLLAAQEVAEANANLPLVDRLNVCNDLIHVYQSAGDNASVTKYTAAFKALAN